MDTLIHLITTLDPRITIGAVITCGILLALMISRALRASHANRDPQRMFIAEHRRICFDRAGYRCEMSALGPLRCQRPAEHADHHFPWARGGASTLDNAVAACPRHNTSKGAKMPSRMQTWVITRRRRRYFPQYTNHRPGAWYR